jgi:hypothetical protein
LAQREADQARPQGHPLAAADPLMRAWFYS